MEWKNEVNDPEMLACEERRARTDCNLVTVWPEAVSKGYARVSCEILPGMQNPFGNVHGGILDYVMDTASGICSTHSIEPLQVVVTRSCEMHYLTPVREGRFYVVARAMKPGRRCCLVSTELYDSEGTLCALGNFEMFYPGVMLEGLPDRRGVSGGKPGDGQKNAKPLQSGGGDCNSAEKKRKKLQKKVKRKTLLFGSESDRLTVYRNLRKRSGKRCSIRPEKARQTDAREGKSHPGGKTVADGKSSAGCPHEGTAGF